MLPGVQEGVGRSDVPVALAAPFDAQVALVGPGASDAQLDWFAGPPGAQVGPEASDARLDWSAGSFGAQVALDVQVEAEPLDA